MVVMFFAPHELYVRRIYCGRDEYGRPIKDEVRWDFVCKCRCDDDRHTEIYTDEGKVFRPRYHIVCPRGIALRKTDKVRVMNGDDVRGEGVVADYKTLNVLDYSEIWV